MDAGRSARPGGQRREIPPQGELNRSMAEGEQLQAPQECQGIQLQ